MTASVAGSLLLVLIGIAFLCAGINGWFRVGEDAAFRSRRLTAVIIDLLVGLAALGDGTLSVVGEPERGVVWLVGSAALVVSVALLVVWLRREHALHL